MDIQDAKNTREGGEGESNKPRDGKRPQGNGNHNHNHNRNRNRGKATPPTTASLVTGPPWLRRPA